MNATLDVNCKLIVIIVKKGQASTVVKAAKQAGSEGATTLFGKGTGIREKARFWGIEIEPEKEIIVMIVLEPYVASVLRAVVEAADLNKPGKGIGFVIDTTQVGGICHLSQSTSGPKPGERAKTHKEEQNRMTETPIVYDLIVTIVNKGHAETVVEASRKAGAEGGTILSGRGTGIHEHAKLFNILIEPEKEVVLTLINRELTQQVLERILDEAELNKPGKGIAFVLPVDTVVGINHALNRMINEHWKKKQK
ncbi:nitrogen regulatory protein P-II [Caldalkalibacillus thermarum]|uniref:P-II family nitrogen regulator n=1 Tax=Caldalkalibacillus thermarum TaxID=296745 RepID=UPI001662DC43|nr:P-II family nitrogen regulator [Caldalkalibacillus thermarum]GGK11373.1 nitrogen regulatory protein P-II [Caldalkalibacillus thermarum]